MAKQNWWAMPTLRLVGNAHPTAVELVRWALPTQFDGVSMAFSHLELLLAKQTTLTLSSIYYIDDLRMLTIAF